ncbi:unnamed protein product, partial [Allacma fusca]
QDRSKEEETDFCIANWAKGIFPF